MNFLKKIPREKLLYFVVSAVIAILTNRLFYDGARLINQNRAMHDLSIPLDEKIPFLPWTVSVYFGCAVFWGMIYLLVALRDRRESDRFFLGLMLGRILCFAFYLIYPTRCDPVSLEGYPPSVWMWVMRFLHTVDSPENLFPSLHCLLAWACWVGVRFKKDISVWWRISAIVMAVAVCLSTLTTKQHVLADVPGGILAAELTYFIAGRRRVLAPYSKAISKIVAKIDGLFFKKSGEERTPGAK